MARQKFGGRTKGTQNKVTSEVKEAFAAMLNQYVIEADPNKEGSFIFDLTLLEPRERLAMVEKYASYVLPKMQSSQIDVNAVQVTIEDKLRKMCGFDKED